jgi:hypothetical protein
VYNDFGDKVIVYVDLVIGSTLVVNYSLLKTIKLIFKEKKNITRMSLALVASVASLGFFFVSNPYLVCLRYLYGILIAAIAFDWHNKKEAIMKTVIFYLMNFAFVGTLEVFNIQNSLLIFIALLYIVFLVLVESFKKIVINPSCLAYDVSIRGTYFSLRGFLDTGNQSMFEGTPIVFIDQKYQTDKFHFVSITSIRTVSSETDISIYEGPDIIINKKTMPVYYAFLSLKDYDVLLNLLLF